MKKSKKEKKPFFSKFLESQSEEETENIKGGGRIPYATTKYPSDTDDDGPLF